MARDTGERWRLGIGLSLTGHAILCVLLLVELKQGLHDFQEPIIYSVTLEGAKQLGGREQIPKDDKQQPMVPPKNVRSIPVSNPVEPQADKQKPQKEQPLPEDPEADISLQAKPTKTPVPTQAPSATKAPAAAPTAKPTGTPVPKSAPTVKAPVTATKAPAKAQAPQVSNDDKQLQASLQKYLGESTNAGGKNWGGATLGGRGGGGGQVRPPEFFIYREQLQRHIKSRWRWFDTRALLKCQVDFDLSPRGQISNVRLYSTSGNREFDESALRAVEKGNPAPVPPQKVYEYFRSVRMTFDPQE